MFVSELSHNPDGLTMCLPIPATSNTSAVCCKCGSAIENIPDYLLNVADMVCRKCAHNLKTPAPIPEKVAVKEYECTKCKVTKPRNEFGTQCDKRHKECKTCKAMYTHQRSVEKREAKRNAKAA